MVGVAAGVIPGGDTWVEGPDVNNPVAETYTPEDRAFIVHARTDIPDMLDEIERLNKALLAARTVTPDMVDRALSAYQYTWHSWTPRRRLFDTHYRTVAALTAALTGALNPDASS
ncbi:hypothetical protein [Kocuria sp. CPCC 205297]|uniref:hypothetical protein n=1 Tax=Kocuria sp. CPCC 205297 TaxID=3073558 RepID=UPI0034D75EBC